MGSRRRSVSVVPFASPGRGTDNEAGIGLEVGLRAFRRRWGRSLATGGGCLLTLWDELTLDLTGRDHSRFWRLIRGL